MYRIWLSKHVLDYCGNNVQLYYWSKGTHSPKCDFCTVEDEYTMHICLCRDPGCDAMFKISVSELCFWVKETLGDTSIITTIELYLLTRGTVTMSSCVHSNNADLSTAAPVSDLLGWDSFIKGRIVTQRQTVATPFLLRRTSVLLQSFWAESSSQNSTTSSTSNVSTVIQSSTSRGRMGGPSPRIKQSCPRLPNTP